MSATPERSVLDARGVSVRLGGRQVLERVDLAVGQGEFVGLLGPNGAGKTTLLRAVMGLVPVHDGTVHLAGARRRSQRLVGYVPQRHEFAWSFPISIEHAVLSARMLTRPSWARPSRADWSAVLAAVDRVGLGELSARPVGELSGGQRQRVLVARALVLEPQLLLADEPYAGLDLPTQELLAELFASLASEGRSVIMATHDLLGAVQGCTRLVLLDREVVADGAPSELSDPQAWRRTFAIGEAHPLLGVLTGA